MNAILSPSFGNPAAVREASIGNACYERAIKLGYSRISAQTFARMGKQQVMSMETPAACAMRIVHPKTHSAMHGGRGPTGFAA